MRAAVALALALAAPAPAAAAPAGSTRYPPEPVDADRAAEQYSEFWERALEPDRGRYDVLLAGARELMKRNLDLPGAIEALGRAIEVLPDAPDAYFLRGWAHELGGAWAACADDYAAATERDPAFAPAPSPRTRGPLADGLGLCLARVGKFEEAAAVLAQHTAAGEAAAATWMRLGEAYMALGRLDDAIAALDRAADKARGAEYTPVRWLRATAYDRARRPSEAVEEAGTALRGDPYNRTRVTLPDVPAAPAEDFFYLTGLAYAARAGAVAAQPEQALLYFREFLAQATASPWRRRAEEHVAALRDVDPTDALGRPGAKQGTSTLTPAAIGKLVKKDVAAMSGCLGDLPQVVVEVRIVLHGAPAPVARDAVVVARPTAGAAARVLNVVGTLPAAADTRGALQCVEKAAGKLKVPKLERGTWLQLVFPIIAR